MKNLEEILHHYTRGDKPLNETNQALKELDCGLQLDPTAISSPLRSWRKPCG